MNREAEIERCVNAVLDLQPLGLSQNNGQRLWQMYRDADEAKATIKAVIVKALELPKQEPQHHIVDSNKMINYVPMTDDEWETLYKTYEQLIYDPSPSPKYIEAEVVRRMTKQGLL